MSAPTRPQRKLPDVATETRPDQAGALDGVGMERIEMPVLLPGPDGIAQRTSARVDAFVNLARDDRRGIHMSRLYLHLDRHLSAEPLTPASLRRCLRDRAAPRIGAGQGDPGRRADAHLGPRVVFRRDG